MCRLFCFVEEGDGEVLHRNPGLAVRIHQQRILADAEVPRALARLPSFRPDVALIDLGLPGMDGYTLARMVREHPGGAETRLVAVTGYGQSRDRERALAAGFDRHVTKPVDPLALERLVSEL